MGTNELGKGADLSGANLSGADLSRANLSGADLSEADLSEADLSGADLGGANLSGADFSGANLSKANLIEADLSGANLSEADLSGANLDGANLRRANLSGTNLSRANLSGAVSLLDPAVWLQEMFDADDNGIIVFRAQRGHFAPPAHWRFAPGQVLTEVANPDRGTDCGCGVAFATWAWAKTEYTGPYWRCRIRWIDLAGVVVPFGTRGKARCWRLELIETVE